MSSEGIGFITPTYQSVLSNQLRKVADAIDEGDVVDSFVKLKTLIMLLKPDHRNPLLENEVAHIDKQINQVMQRKGVDQYQTWLLHGSGVRRVLQHNLRTLFMKVMEKLHQGGYLERLPIKPKAKGPGRLRVDE